MYIYIYICISTCVYIYIYSFVCELHMHIHNIYTYIMCMYDGMLPRLTWPSLHSSFLSSGTSAYTSLLHKFAPYYKFSIEPRAHIGQHGKHTGLPTRHLTCHRFRLCWLMWQHDSFDITWNWMINTQLWYAVSAMSFTPAWHMTHQQIQLTSNWFQKPQLTRQCQHPTYSQSIWGTVRAP